MFHTAWSQHRSARSARSRSLRCWSASTAVRAPTMRSIARRYFVVNLLGADDLELARGFGQPEFRSRRFEQGSWEPLATGAPALTSALAQLRLRDHARRAGAFPHHFRRYGARSQASAKRDRGVDVSRRTVSGAFIQRGLNTVGRVADLIPPDCRAGSCLHKPSDSARGALVPAPAGRRYQHDRSR